MIKSIGTEQEQEAWPQRESMKITWSTEAPEQNINYNWTTDQLVSEKKFFTCKKTFLSHEWSESKCVADTVAAHSLPLYLLVVFGGGGGGGGGGVFDLCQGRLPGCYERIFFY